MCDSAAVDSRIAELQKQVQALQERVVSVDDGYRKWAMVGAAIAIALVILLGKTALELPQAAVAEARKTAESAASEVAQDTASAVAKTVAETEARKQAVATVADFIKPHSLAEIESLVLACQKARIVCETQQEKATEAVAHLQDVSKNFDGMRVENGSLILGSGGVDVQGPLQLLGPNGEVVVRIDPSKRQFGIGPELNIISLAPANIQSQWVVDQRIDTYFQGTVFRNSSKPFGEPR